MKSGENIFISESDFRKRYEYSNSDLLGEGGFAQVFKAYDKQFEEYVALKFYNKGEQGKYDVLSEMKDSRRFAHQNIIRVHDAFVVKFESTGTESFVQVGVLEFANGGNLRDFIKKKPSESQFVTALIGILNGLEYLHSSKNIIHRDLSPENILMYTENDQNIPKIADFGISKKVVTTPGQDQNKSTQLLGKVDYMAPEQFYPEKYGIDGKISTNVDLWAFGIIVYELFTHEKPFSKSAPENPMKIIQAITKNSIPDIEDIPDPYRSVIKRCLEKNATKRVRKPKELVRILEDHLKSMNEFGVVSPPKTKSKNIIKYSLIGIVSLIVIIGLLYSGSLLMGKFSNKKGEKLLLQHQETMQEMVSNQEYRNVVSYYSGLSPEIQSDAEISEMYNSARKINGSIDSLLSLGNEYFKSKQFNEARNVYSEVVNNLDTDNEEALKNITLINTITNNIDSLRKLGDRYYRAENWKLALQPYQEIVDKFNPEDPIALSRIRDIEKKLNPKSSDNGGKKVIPPTPKGKLYTEGMFTVRRIHEDADTKLKAIRVTDTNLIIYMEFLSRDSEIQIHPPASDDAFYVQYNNRQNELALERIVGASYGTNIKITSATTVEFIFGKLPNNVRTFNLLEGKNQLDESMTYWNYIGIKLN